MSFDPHRLARALAAVDPAWRESGVCVALSGGLDSTVLMHAAAALARESGFALRALHVDHGLQAASGAWAEACRAACAAAGVPLEVIAAHVGLPPGASVEAAAREARYEALARALAPGERLLAAHHRDDQLETVLIQLLRGAGVAGLAAMPGRAALGAGWLLRPLLDVDRAALRDYAKAQGLAWVEDPMNSDPRFDRAWLRERVLPAVRERWPSAAATVGRSAAHLAEAARLLDERAAEDAVELLDDGRLALAGLQRLPRDRQVNLLRWWLRRAELRPPPAARLAASLDGFIAARPDGAPALRWADGEVRRYRDRLYALPPLPQAPTAEIENVTGTARELPAGLGRFELVEGNSGGLRAPLPAAPVIRFRHGGESLRPHPRRPRKRLKDLCQESGIVPWMRPRLPLVYVGEDLAAVGDLWIDAQFAASPGEPAFRPVWTGRPPIY